MRRIFDSCFCLILGLSILTSGCSPFIKVEPDKGVSKNQCDPKQALDYADNAIGEMQSQLSEKARFAWTVNNTLIPLAGATLGLGLVGASTKLITGMSVGGATWYTMGLANSNKDLGSIYTKGIDAIICVKKVAISSTLPSQDYETFKKMNGILEGSIVKAQLDLAKIESEKKPELAPIISPAKDQIESAKKFAGDAYTSIVVTSRQANEIVAAVDSIISKVNGYVDRNQTSIEQGAFMAQNISKVAVSFKQSPPVSGVALNNSIYNLGTGEKVNALLKSDTSLADLQKDMTKIQETSIAMSLMLSNFNSVKASSDFKGCGISPEDVAVSIKLLPSNSINIKKGGQVTSRINVTGGKSPYNVMFTKTRSNPPAIDNLQTVTNMVISITVTDATTGGDYDLFITDSAGNDVSAVINVEEPPAPAAPTPPGPGGVK